MGGNFNKDNLENFDQINQDSNFSEEMMQESTKEEENTTSVKGLKANQAIFISGGSFTLDTYDDSIHSNGNITISNGEIEATSGDDGILIKTLTIENGKINILNCYEGLEGNDIIINGGDTYVYFKDDGLNTTTGENI